MSEQHRHRIRDLEADVKRLTWLLGNANELVDQQKLEIEVIASQQHTFDAGWHFGFDAGTQARKSKHDDWIEFQRIWAEDTETL